MAWDMNQYEVPNVDTLRAALRQAECDIADLRISLDRKESTAVQASLRWRSAEAECQALRLEAAALRGKLRARTAELGDILA